MAEKGEININKQDVLETYLKENNYYGANLFTEGASHMVMSNTLIKHQELLHAAIDGSVGAIVMLVDYSKDGRRDLMRAIHELIKKFKEMYPDEAKDIETSMSLLQIVRSSKNEA